MKIGIVGLPNVGKSTLFNALTKSYAADAANFPFCTIEPNVGIVDVRDERIDALAALSDSAKKICATTTFVDIAGLVRGASKGEGMGNAFLSHIREVDAIVQVLRYFGDADINHVDGEVDPLRDKQTIDLELILSDLTLVEKKLPQLRKKAKGRDAQVLKEVAVLERVQEVLEAEQLLWFRREAFGDDERKLLSQYHFLTMKPFVYALNIGEDDVVDAQVIVADWSQRLSEQAGGTVPVVAVCAKMESEMMEMEMEERNEFLTELLGADPGAVPTLDDLIGVAFGTLGLMYYFTTGPKETKAWTICKGYTAPQAAGVIHTDFERGFVKAEVVSCDALLATGSWAGAKAAGQLRLEGKEYVVQDGDVIFFKFAT